MHATRYLVTLTGENPLLLHNDNLQWQEMVSEWQKDPANRSALSAGDDRTPAFRWLGCLYHEQGKLIIPSDNLMTMLREGGARCPTGKKGQTFKRQTQSGIVVNESGWALLVRGKEVNSNELFALKTERDFAVHEQAARDRGFELFVKRAKIGAAKHVRVRPRFDQWGCRGTLTILDDTITARVLTDILTHAGRFAGLGDWRPSSPKSPGRFGTFSVEVAAIK